jgi:hypothetical protein
VVDVELLVVDDEVVVVSLRRCIDRSSGDAVYKSCTGTPARAAFM